LVLPNKLIQYRGNLLELGRSYGAGRQSGLDSVIVADKPQLTEYCQFGFGG